MLEACPNLKPCCAISMHRANGITCQSNPYEAYYEACICNVFADVEFHIPVDIGSGYSIHKSEGNCC